MQKMKKIVLKKIGISDDLLLFFTELLEISETSR